MRRLRVTQVFFSATNYDISALYRGHAADIPIIFAIDQPQAQTPTIYGDLCTSIAAPGPGLFTLDGIGLFGSPNPTLRADPDWFMSFPLTPAIEAALVGVTLSFQIYGLDVSRPFPENAFATNCQTVTFI